MLHQCLITTQMHTAAVYPKFELWVKAKGNPVAIDLILEVACFVVVYYILYKKPMDIQAKQC